MYFFILLVGTMQNKASHFHCLKCEFVCTDTNKVVAHRRQHQKLDSIMAAGFEKFTPSQTCHIEGCAHNRKQTHYHCLSCHYAVLGLSQMSAHKYRHLEWYVVNNRNNYNNNKYKHSYLFADKEHWSENCERMRYEINIGSWQ